ncbi:MAG: TRAP transporter small permease subunit [Oligoflexales bacterium]
MNKILKKINAGLFHISTVLVFVLVFMVFSQVIARYVFNDVSLALQELTWHVFGVVIVFAAAYTLSCDGHVRVDVVYANWKPRTQAKANIVGAIFFLIPFCILMIWKGIEYAWAARSFTHPSDGSFLAWLVAGEASADPGGLPGRWIIKSLVPLCGLSMLMQAISEIIKHFKLSKEERPS